MKSLCKYCSLGLLTLSLLVAVGCGNKRPVLYPNAHLEKVGMQVGQADIDACIAKSEAYGAEKGAGKESGRKIATNTGAAAAAGAVLGAVLGNNAGRAALASGGAAMAGTAVSETANADAPGYIHEKFVNTCLEEKGYKIVGWK